MGFYLPDQPNLGFYEKRQSWGENWQAITRDDWLTLTSQQTIEQAKENKLRALSDIATVKTASIIFNGHTYQTDVIAKERFAAEEQAINRGDRPDPSPWRTLNNQLVDLSNADFLALISAIYSRHRQVILTSFGHKDEILQLGSIADVDAYDLSTGWP